MICIAAVSSDRLLFVSFIAALTLSSILAYRLSIYDARLTSAIYFRLAFPHHVYIRNTVESDVVAAVFHVSCSIVLCVSSPVFNLTLIVLDFFAEDYTVIISLTVSRLLT